MSRILLVFVGAFAAATLSSAAIAAPEPRTSLVRCGAQSCLQVAGYRDDPDAIVSINGHPVSVEGERRWKAHLPVELVREWSAANARTIDVSLDGPQGQQGAAVRVALPIGLFADTTTLASLVINVR